MSLLRDPKRLLAILIAGVCGLIVLIDFGGGGGIFAIFARILVDWAAIITAIAVLLGLISVAGSHVQRVRQRSTDWPYSIVLIGAILVVIAVGIFFPLPGRGGLVLPGSLAEEPLRIFFRTVYEPLAGSLLALLAFFSLSAALRALRRRSIDAFVIVLVACVVLLTQIPPIADLPGLTPIMQWVNDYVALAGARGLLLGTAIGAFVAGIRVLLGFDTPYLDR